MERINDEKPMGFTEIKDLIKSKSNIDKLTYDYHSIFTECNLNYEQVEHVGGEDEGVEWYRVFFFKDYNVYAKLDGAYYSYDGVNFDGWDDFFEVTPKEVMVTQYQKVK